MKDLPKLKVHRDPRFEAFPYAHPYHESRFIITTDAELEKQPPSDEHYRCFPGDWRVAATKGSVIAKLYDTEHQAEYARLFARAPETYVALKNLMNMIEFIGLTGPPELEGKVNITLEAAREALRWPA